MLNPDYVIFLGGRALLSFIGISAIVTGTWRSERRWDAKADKLTSAAEDQYVSLGDDKDEWDFHRGYSTITAVGWVALALSYIFDRTDFWTIQTTPLVFVAVFLVLSLGVVQTVLMRQAVEQRKMEENKMFFLATLGFGIVGDGVLTAVMDPDAPNWPAPLGAICIALAPALMWHERRMGHMYDRAGKANPTPTLFNAGGPLLIFGFFWMFIGVNATGYIGLHGAENKTLPLFFAGRTFLAYLGATFVIASTWVAFGDHEDSEGDGIDAEDPKVGDGFLSEIIGPKGEIKVFLFGSWLLLACTNFLPSFVFTAIVLMGLMIAQGFVYTLLYDQGLLIRSRGGMKWWVHVNQAVMVGQAIVVSLHGLYPFLFVAISLPLTGWGLLRVFQDMKKGMTWVGGQAPKNTPVVFSYGVPVFVLGMLFFAWAVSIPPTVF